MVRATIIITTLVGLIASVAAVPHSRRSVDDIQTGDVVFDSLDLSYILSDFLDINKISIEDFINCLSILGGLTKRGEAAAPQTVRIARTADVIDETPTENEDPTEA